MWTLLASKFFSDFFEHQSLIQMLQFSLFELKKKFPQSLHDVQVTPT